MMRTPIRSRAILALLLLTSLFMGCRSAEESAPAVRPVRAVQLTATGAAVTREFPGVVQAVRETKLAFRVAGPIEEILVDEGASVTTGQLVARLDPRDYQVRVDAAGARCHELAAQLERVRAMYENGHVARADLDRIQAGHDMAAAELRAAENALHDTRLLAPFDGRVGLQLSEEHDVVAAGQPILTFLDAAGVEVRAGVPEDLMVAADSFGNFEVRLESWPGRVFPARLRELGRRPQPVNQTYALTVVPDLPANVNALAGMTARVRFTHDPQDGGAGFVVPLTAIANGADHRSRVWIYDPVTGKVGAREVAVGRLNSAGVAVVGDLREGDWLVTAGANVLVEGQQVRLLEAPAASNVGGAM